MVFGDKTLYPWTLTWAEVDPAQHPFDADGVFEVVASLPPATNVPSYPPPPEYRGNFIWDTAYPWAEAMSAGLIDHYGRWAGGWGWTYGEGDLDGGPMHTWSFAAYRQPSREAKLAVVAESLMEWRRWLEDLAERFARFLPLPADPDYALDTWERAVAH